MGDARMKDEETNYVKIERITIHGCRSHARRPRARRTHISLIIISTLLLCLPSIMRVFKLIDVIIRVIDLALVYHLDYFHLRRNIANATEKPFLIWAGLNEKRSRESDILKREEFELERIENERV